MAVSLLFLSFTLIFALVIIKSYTQSLHIHDLAIALIKTTVIWGLLLLVILETLNLFKAVSWIGLLVSWLVVSLVIAVWIIQSKETVLFRFSNIAWPTFSKLEKFFITFIGVIMLILLIIALYTPPNNFDSLTYHMARVAHWMQSKSIDHFATHIIRQLYQPPFMEFVILNFQILSGSDVFANLVQWFALFLCVIGASLIAKELDASRQTQLATSIFVSTIPMPILQATSAKNDLVLAFFLVTATYYLLRIIKRNSHHNICFFSMAIGLSILTKATGYLFATPLLVWFLVTQLRPIKINPLKSFMALSIVGSGIITINLGHYSRNYEVYENFLGSSKEDRNQYSNEIYSFQAFSSNVIRNLALHFKTPHESIDKVFQKAIVALHNTLNFDISDSRTTWGNSSFSMSGISYHEDTAGNFLHITMIISALVLSFKKITIKQDMKLLLQILTVIACFTLFCFYLKWQPWHSRLHTPLFILSAPFCMIILLKNIKQRAYMAILIVMILASLPWVLRNSSRKILPITHSIFTKSQTELLFENNGSHHSPTIEVIDLIRRYKFKTVGLYLTGDDFDYPYWRMLKNSSGDTFLAHVMVKNKSSYLIDENFVPDCIVSTYGWGPSAHLKEEEYIELTYKSPIHLYALKSIVEARDIPFGKKSQRYLDEMQLKVLTKKTIEDLKKLKEALEKYYIENNNYPQSSGGWDGIYSEFGQSKEDWIPGLVPKYLDKLPMDPRLGNDGIKQYLYKSDGESYKLIAHQVLNFSELSQEYPEMIDPKRASWAIGFWTENSKDW